MSHPTQVNQVRLGDIFLKDAPHRISHDRCLWEARMRRDRTARSLPECEEMRAALSQMKRHTLAHLDHYLEEFERNATANGIHVHWARDAEEHNRAVLAIMQAHGVRTVTKGKSMLMDECGLTPALEAEGIEVYEADLGERIQQLDRQRPSHIVMPAIHKLRTDVARLFADHLGSDPSNDDPTYLNSVMRKDMRRHYAVADCGMNGVNIAIAETGGIVVCTNEGNADISANVPPLFIASMGIEKVVPTKSAAALQVRMLSRSALGFAITQYTSHYHAPREGQEMHIIIVDNGRSDRLGEDYWEVLKCIRCGACMNTCPVFRRTSGLSYDAPYMGPIGIVLEPSYDLYRYARLPYSCTHCGSCGNVCPAMVPIPSYVFYWRDRVVEKKYDEPWHRLQMDAARLALKNPRTLSATERMALWALKHLLKSVLESGLNPWVEWHDNPEAPPETFREYYRRTMKQGDKNV